MIPYILMALLFLALAVLAAFESSFSSLQILPWFNGMTWLRVHLITLGALTQILFGALPFVTAMRNRLPRPHMRWDIWLTLNAGILTLLVGIPLVNRVPIILGGTLVFIATVLLIQQLLGMQSAARRSGRSVSGQGNKFYIAGLAYFLVGVVIGTGLWTGWMEPLGVVGNAREVHIHANNWGLMSLLFAGLFFDLYPTWTGRQLANPGAATPIFWLMTAGAFGLIFGPWLALEALLVPGLVLHLVATVWLLVLVVKPLRGQAGAWSAGIVHLIVAYFWILAPIAMAPFVLFGVGDLPGDVIETFAPQALVYGWLLQFGFAVIPFFVARTLAPHEEARLGGTWFSFVLVNLGSVILWASIFIAPAQALLRGVAYLVWMVAVLPIVGQLFGAVRAGLAQLERAPLHAGASDSA